MPKNAKNGLNTQQSIALSSLLDEVVGKCGEEAVFDALAMHGAKSVDGISQDDYWGVISELQLLCVD